MSFDVAPRIALPWLAAVGFASVSCVGAHAHDHKVGAIVIDHPYAVTSAAGSTIGEVYFRALRNTGTEPDRLVSAQTGIADSARVQRQSAAGDSVAAQPASGLEIAPNSEVRVRHDGEWVVLLQGLKSPLKKRDNFTLALRFERAGRIEVPVTVELPRASRKD